jgi:hypothetical protein
MSRQLQARDNGKVPRYELEKRLNTMELSFQRQLQARDREIQALKLRVSDLEKGAGA